MKKLMKWIKEEGVFVVLGFLIFFIMASVFLKELAN